VSGKTNERASGAGRMNKPTPAMIKVLREAKYFGDLVERDGWIYSWRRDQPVCNKATALAMVERGWLNPARSKYQITNAGKLFGGEL
jgi:hypothetical protein